MQKPFFLFITILFLVGCRFGDKAKTGGKERIVCVSKQLTELLFALHQGNKIMGVDLSSTYPPEATRLTTVGYHPLLNAEGIVSLDPKMVVYESDVTPPNVMPQLAQVTIRIKVTGRR